MRAALFALFLFAPLAEPAAAFQRVVRFPRVYGDTGRPYGPTQANYRYERRYGRTWHGVGGATTVVSPTKQFHVPYSYSPLTVYGPVIADYYSINGVYGGYGLPFHSGYAPVYGYAPVAPAYVPVVPQYVAPPFFNNEVIQRGLLENDLRWNQPLQITPAPPNNARKPEPSNTAAILKSMRAQSNGDFLFQRQEYHNAYERYHQAVRAAPDRAEAHFRLAFVLTALSRFDSAVAYFKRGLRLDPKWPVTGASLGRIFGRHNELAKTAVLGRVTRWVKEDIRDPDRLFLLGVLLYFDNHTDKSAVLFEAAYRLAGTGDHLKAFLLAGQQASAKKPPAKPKAARPAPAPKQDDAPPKPGVKAKPQGPLLPPMPKP